MTQRHRHLAPLARMAVLVAIGDYVTKDLAVRWLAHEPTSVNEWLQFAVVHNERAAFGFSLGAYTWHLNLAITLGAILFVVAVSRELSRVDKSAPVALGLIVGGAIGNLASLILSPRGVVDFIAVHVSPTSGLILNVADVAAYLGLAMIVRTGFLIVAAMRREMRIKSPVVAPTPPLVEGLFAEREVSRPVFREPAAGIEVEVPHSDRRPDIRRPLSVDTPRAFPARMLEFPGSRVSGRDDASLGKSPPRGETR